MKILLVTTWDTPCGIAEHSFYLKQAVEAADPEIEIVPDVDALDPNVCGLRDYTEIVHLNYQASLHSRWTPETIRVAQATGRKVVVTFHDTGVPNSDLCKAICEAADAFVIHEPADDLPMDKGHYWRMGVPDWPSVYEDPMEITGRPCLGSIGFPFPWKHYEELARLTKRAGWALLLIAPNATPTQVAEWTTLNPQTKVFVDFIHRYDALNLLAVCDATAFTYVCHNTGQSGAILQGIAARKPVIALKTCRQFRALYGDNLGGGVIRWCETFEEIEAQLLRLPIQRVDPGIVALAEQDSWQQLGHRYATLYRSLIA